jgi:CRISP-associated protein Cas1
VLGIEGHAACDYFRGLALLASGAMAGRTRRPPLDPVNCLLSFGYGMLRVAVHGALEQVGLDPYPGYLHGIRSGKPALALDLMEEFRPLLVDRLVLTLVNREQLNRTHTETLPGGPVQLTDDGRRFFLKQWSTARQREWHTPDSAETSLLRCSHLSKRDCWRAISAATVMPTYPGRRANGPTCSDFA